MVSYRVSYIPPYNIFLCSLFGKSLWTPQRKEKHDWKSSVVQDWLPFRERSFGIKKRFTVLFCFGILNNLSNICFEMASLFMKSCWLAALDQDQNFSIKKPMLWSFLLPVALILLFNIIIFIKIIVSVIWKENKDLTRWDGTELLRSFRCIPWSLVKSSGFLVTNLDFWENLLF